MMYKSSACACHYFIIVLSALNDILKTRLHGQHLVRPVIVKALRAHLKNPNPQKALALSFHGWTGTGKNFVAGLITDHLYYYGRNSRYVHLFAATHHFPHESHIETYKVCDDVNTFLIAKGHAYMLCILLSHQQLSHVIYTAMNMFTVQCYYIVLCV